MTLRKSNVSTMNYRNLAIDERELINRIIKYKPLRRPVDINLKIGDRVKEILPDGTIEFMRDQEGLRVKQIYYPVEAQFLDDDGVPINALIFFIDNEVSMLEIVKADGSAPSRKPLPEEWEIIDLSY